MTVKFNATREDDDLIHRVVLRAARFGLIDGDLTSITMDLTACHCNGCPLRLHDMLGADDFNFMHDMLGIKQHINRRTGQLEDCFVPRFAVTQ